MILGVDFDGVIAKSAPPRVPLELREDADLALRTLSRRGHALILHSVRCQAGIAELLRRGVLDPAQVPPRFAPDVHDAPARFAEMRSFLRERKLWTLEEGGVFAAVWTLPGKPYCDLYLDDRAVNMKGPAAWRQFVAAYG